MDQARIGWLIISTYADLDSILDAVFLSLNDGEVKLGREYSGGWKWGSLERESWLSSSRTALLSLATLRASITGLSEFCIYYNSHTCD